MPWAALLSAAYVMGFLAFWRLCRTAPVMPEDTVADPPSLDEPSEQPNQDPT